MRQIVIGASNVQLAFLENRASPPRVMFIFSGTEELLITFLPHLLSHFQSLTDLLRGMTLRIASSGVILNIMQIIIIMIIIIIIAFGGLYHVKVEHYSYDRSIIFLLLPTIYTHLPFPWCSKIYSHF